MLLDRARGLLAASMGMLVLTVGCGEPELKTALRSAGPPDVLSVMVYNDPFFGLLESATYCKENDEKAPGFVGLPDYSATVVCPEDGTAASKVLDTAPIDWFVRVQFDELLDPSIEELICEGEGADIICTGSLELSHPVNLRCDGAELPYSGYYVPNGNSVSWPVGPNLTVAPVDYLGSSEGCFALDDANCPALAVIDCELEIGADLVFDKQGEQVPADQRGPFGFSIAPLTMIDYYPYGDPDATAICAELAVDDNRCIAGDESIELYFNAMVDPASIAADITVTDGTNPVTDLLIEGDPDDPSIIYVTSQAGFTPGTTYTFAIGAGAQLADVVAGSLTFVDAFEVDFAVADL